MEQQTKGNKPTQEKKKTLNCWTDFDKAKEKIKSLMAENRKQFNELYQLKFEPQLREQSQEEQKLRDSLYWADKIIASLKESNRFYYDYCMKLLNGLPNVVSDKLMQLKMQSPDMQSGIPDEKENKKPCKKRLICINVDPITVVHSDGRSTIQKGSGLEYLCYYTASAFSTDNDNKMLYHINELNGDVKLAERFYVREDEPGERKLGRTRKKS